MKITKAEAAKINFSESAKIISYDSHSKSISVARITINGRHPQEDSSYFIEHDCHVLLYIISGTGKIAIENDTYDLEQEDTITIQAGKKYFIQGNLDYLASTSPHYYPEQNEIVEI